MNSTNFLRKAHNRSRFIADAIEVKAAKTFRGRRWLAAIAIGGMGATGVGGVLAAVEIGTSHNETIIIPTTQSTAPSPGRTIIFGAGTKGPENAGGYVERPAMYTGQPENGTSPQNGESNSLQSPTASEGVGEQQPVIGSIVANGPASSTGSNG